MKHVICRHRHNIDFHHHKFCHAAVLLAAMVTLKAICSNTPGTYDGGWWRGSDRCVFQTKSPKVSLKDEIDVGELLGRTK